MRSRHVVLEYASCELLAEHYKTVDVIYDVGDASVEVVHEVGFGDEFTYIRKNIDASELDPNIGKLWMGEADILRQLEHPNIVRLCACAVDATSDKLVLVLEHQRGGDCSDFLAKAGGMVCENFAACIAKQLFNALACCHENGIIHRDVKAENVMFAESLPCEGVPDLRVIDFGLSTRYDASRPLKSGNKIGTPAYMAPELLKEREIYGPAVDVWAAGILIFQLLIGKCPFGPEYGWSDRKVYAQVKSYAASATPEQVLRDVAKSSSNPERWDELSKEAREFLLSLLSADQSQRPLASDVAQHPWLQLAAPKPKKRSFGGA